MDFGAILHKAQKNGAKKEPARYYSTKFEPPKKEQRNKELSANIKKFLEKKEQEEKKKQGEATKKRGELLALRAKDKKATKRVNVMLKRTKSANQSVISDAVDDDNTAVTLSGPAQPDEDDYGYVSQEASAFYNKMMEKYSKAPDEPKFKLGKTKKVSTNLSSTKDRVKAALDKEQEEALLPHRRKRKHKESDDTAKDASPTREPEVVVKKKEKPKFKPAPAMNFAELLKIAEKKQFEPIVIEVKPKEDEKPLTKKQKKELEQQREYKERRKNGLPPPPTERPAPTAAKTDKNNGRIPKLGASTSEKTSEKTNKDAQSTATKQEKKLEPTKNIPISTSSSGNTGKSNCYTNKTNTEKPNQDNRRKEVPPPAMSKNGLASSQPTSSGKPRPPLDKSRTDANRDRPNDKLKPTKPPLSKENKPKLIGYGRPNPYQDALIRRPMQKGVNNKRRIIDDDDSEYDSEMDDFIDDGPDDVDDYSKHISEIFGYNKSKYAKYDDEDDIDNMESSFAQQMKEEVISKNIAIKEDLEDMKLEEQHKRKKALLKKKN